MSGAGVFRIVMEVMYCLLSYL